jgi:hypothetical protein
VVVLTISGCTSSKELWNPAKTSEFRYKSTNKTLFLSQDKKVCIVDEKNQLPTSKQSLKEFVKSNWKGYAVLVDKCTDADYYLILQLHDSFKYDRQTYTLTLQTTKLTIFEKSSKNVVADYTINNTQYSRFVDKKETMDKFCEFYMDPKRIFIK